MSSLIKAVVVGGGSGIGAAVVERLRERGARILVWDIAGSCDIVCDITDPAQVTAGVGHARTLLDAPPEDWDRVMGINAKGVWLAMRELARPMLDGDGGSIVVTSSVSATLADRTMGLYCASKAALDMLVKVAAVEWAPRVRVNGVAPGVTETPMLHGAPVNGAWLSGVARRTAMDRLGTADDIAQCILALHDLSWVTGEILRSDGGLSLRSPISPGAG
jgi:NAD(P)-dependent dehydrogenase (short-subunit alcohol dehydrogenase family)